MIPNGDVCNKHLIVQDIDYSMIKSFKHKGLEQLFYDGIVKGVQVKHAGKLEAILDFLDIAETVAMMNFPGSRLHLLQPKKEQRWAVKVSGN